MTTEISRDVVDAGFRFTLSAPDDWLEYPSEGALLTLAGDLGQPEGTLRPSVQWSAARAQAGPEIAFAAVRRSLIDLPEATVVSEEASAELRPNYSVVVAFRNPDTQATQLALVFAQYIEGKVPAVLQVVGNCGGAAGQDVVLGLAKVVKSTTVAPLGGEA